MIVLAFNLQFNVLVISFIIAFALLMVKMIQKYIRTKNVSKSEMYDAWHDDPSKWKLFFFYYNPEDPRIFVNKRISFLGWTLNWAQPASWFVLLIITAFIVFTILLAKN